jgi:hypothetical protein
MTHYVLTFLPLCFTSEFPSVATARKETTHQPRRSRDLPVVLRQHTEFLLPLAPSDRPVLLPCPHPAGHGTIMTWWLHCLRQQWSLTWRSTRMKRRSRGSRNSPTDRHKQFYPREKPSKNPQHVHRWEVIKASCLKLDSVAWVRKWTIPTDRKPLVKLVTTFEVEGETWSAWRIHTAIISAF